MDSEELCTPFKGNGLQQSLQVISIELYLVKLSSISISKKSKKNIIYMFNIYFLFTTLFFLLFITTLYLVDTYI